MAHELTREEYEETSQYMLEKFEEYNKKVYDYISRIEDIVIRSDNLYIDSDEEAIKYVNDICRPNLYGIRVKKTNDYLIDVSATNRDEIIYFDKDFYTTYLSLFFDNKISDLYSDYYDRTSFDHNSIKKISNGFSIKYDKLIRKWLREKDRSGNYVAFSWKTTLTHLDTYLADEGFNKLIEEKIETSEINYEDIIKFYLGANYRYRMIKRLINLLQDRGVTVLIITDDPSCYRSNIFRNMIRKLLNLKYDDILGRHLLCHRPEYGVGSKKGDLVNMMIHGRYCQNDGGYCQNKYLYHKKNYKLIKDIFSDTH